MEAIIGLGNQLKGDDGIGILLVREIEKKELASNIEVFDAGIRGLRLLHLLKDLEKALIVDAVRFGGEPGDSVFFSPDEVESLNEFQSTHDMDFLEVLELSKTLEEEPDGIVIMGVEPKDTSFGESISPELKHRLPQLVEDLSKKAVEMFGPNEKH